MQCAFAISKIEQTFLENKVTLVADVLQGFGYFLRNIKRGEAETLQQLMEGLGFKDHDLVVFKHLLAHSSLVLLQLHPPEVAYLFFLWLGRQVKPRVVFVFDFRVQVLVEDDLVHGPLKVLVDLKHQLGGLHVFDFLRFCNGLYPLLLLVVYIREKGNLAQSSRGGSCCRCRSCSGRARLRIFSAGRHLSVFSRIYAGLRH